MQVVLTVKNTHKIIEPSKNSVILYDGKNWYVTTKEKLFEEWTALINKCQQELVKLQNENAQFKSDVSQQLLEMTSLIQKLFDLKGEDL